MIKSCLFTLLSIFFGFSAVADEQLVCSSTHTYYRLESSQGSASVRVGMKVGSELLLRDDKVVQQQTFRAGVTSAVMPHFRVTFDASTKKVIQENGNTIEGMSLYTVNMVLTNLIDRTGPVGEEVLCSKKWNMQL